MRQYAVYTIPPSIVFTSPGVAVRNNLAATAQLAVSGNQDDAPFLQEDFDALFAAGASWMTEAEARALVQGPDWQTPHPPGVIP